MRLFDKKFRQNKQKYILQCLIAMVIVGIISILLDLLLQTTILASVGATVFIIFTMPHTKRSRPRYILGGYTIGVVTGTLCYLLVDPSILYMHSILAAVSVGLCIFFMVVTNTEHPPAAAVAMGIVVEGIDFYTIVIIYLSIVIVLLGKRIMTKWLIDLL